MSNQSIYHLTSPILNRLLEMALIREHSIESVTILAQQLLLSKRPRFSFFIYLYLIFDISLSRYVGFPFFYPYLLICNSYLFIWWFNVAMQGYIFGGYTPLHWVFSRKYAYDKKTFLFSLVNPKVIKSIETINGSYYSHPTS